MSNRNGFGRSSIGKKWIIALTGVVLVGFVLGHLVGNLQIFLPNKNQLNAYGALLHGLGPLLWVVRAFLLACVSIHLWLTIELTLENRRARPLGYEKARFREASWAGRYMAVSGLIVLGFIIFHILHFTANVIDPGFANIDQVMANGAVRHDVYRMVVVGLHNPLVSVFYILGMVLLCLHLSHGLRSLVQTLGLKTSKLAPWIDHGGPVLAVILCLGFIAIPVSVMTGILHL
jgi:succinate dehydrogenase / fumarate reductase cytochrome b subunit